MTSIKAAMEQQMRDPKRVLEIARSCTFEQVIIQLDDLAQKQQAKTSKNPLLRTLSNAFAWSRQTGDLTVASAGFMGRLLEIAHENIEAGNVEQGIERLLIARDYNTKYFHLEAGQEYIDRRLQEAGYTEPDQTSKPDFKP